MRRNPPRLLLIATLLLLIPASSSPGQFVSERKSDIANPAEGAADVDRVEKLIIEQTNEFRKKQDLEPVQPNSELDAAAEYFAGFMARTNKYGHQADGQTPSERAEEHGYDYCIVSENIAMQYSSLGFKTPELARKFVTGWKESPEHRKNMLAPDVTDIGVAVAQSESSGRYYAVQMFGRPKSKQIAFEIVNQSGATVQYSVGEQSFELPPRYTRTHQRCRPAKLVFPREQADDTTFQPQDGDRFVVTEGEDGGYEVRRAGASD